MSADSLIGPAVTATAITLAAGIITWTYKLISDSRDRKIKRINTAEIMLAQIQQATEILGQFSQYLDDISENIIKSKDHAFFVPVTDSFEKMVLMLEQQLLLLPPTLVNDIIKFYCYDKSLNEVLKEMSDSSFISVDEERKREVIKQTACLAEQERTLGIKLIGSLNGYINNERKTLFIRWNIQKVKFLSYLKKIKNKRSLQQFPPK